MTIKKEINSVADVIRSKEQRGEDATFERDLLKAWSKYDGYGLAKEVLGSLPQYPPHAPQSKSRRVKG